MKKTYICPQISDNEEYYCEFDLLGVSSDSDTGITYGGTDDDGTLDPAAKIFRFDTPNESEEDDEW